MPADPQQLAQLLQQYRNAAPELQQPQQPLFGPIIQSQASLPMQPQQPRSWQSPQQQQDMQNSFAQGLMRLQQGNAGSQGNAFLPSQAFLNNNWGY